MRELTRFDRCHRGDSVCVCSSVCAMGVCVEKEQKMRLRGFIQDRIKPDWVDQLLYRVVAKKRCKDFAHSCHVEQSEKVKVETRKHLPPAPEFGRKKFVERKKEHGNMYMIKLTFTLRRRNPDLNRYLLSVLL